MLLRPRPGRAIRAGAPRCSPPSHKTARSEPSTPRRGSPVRDPRAQEQDGHPRHRRIDDPPAHQSEVVL